MARKKVKGASLKSKVEQSTCTSEKVKKKKKKANTQARDVPILGSGSRNPHRTVTAVDSLHLDERTLLVVFIGKAHEPVAAALARHGVGHDLGRLARGEASLEERDQDIFVDLGAKVADEDAVLGAAVVAIVGRH